MIPSPPFLDVKHRELVEFQKRTIDFCERIFAKEVMG